MIKKTVNYVDFNEQPQSEVIYFHVTAEEWLRKSIDGGFSYGDKVEEALNSGRPETVLATPEGRKMLELFEFIILGAYGVRSEDGKRFIKSKINRDEFQQTAAYDQLVIDFLLHPDVFGAFITNLMPAEIRAAADAERAKQPTMDSRSLEAIGKTDQAALNAISVPQLAPEEPTPVDAPKPASRHVMSYEEYVASQNPDNLQ